MTTPDVNVTVTSREFSSELTSLKYDSNLYVLCNCFSKLNSFNNYFPLVSSLFFDKSKHANNIFLEKNCSFMTV